MEKESNELSGNWNNRVTQIMGNKYAMTLLLKTFFWITILSTLMFVYLSIKYKIFFFYVFTLIYFIGSLNILKNYSMISNVRNMYRYFVFEKYSKNILIIMFMFITPFLIYFYGGLTEFIIYVLGLIILNKNIKQIFKRRK